MSTGGGGRGGGLAWLGIVLLIAVALAVVAHFSPDFGELLGNVIAAIVGVIVGVVGIIVGVLGAIVGVVAAVFAAIIGVFAGLLAVAAVALPFIVPILIILAIGFAIGRRRKS